jgi:hypothetical protein
MLGRFLHSDSVIWQFYTNPILLEFVLGVSLFLLYKHRPELVSKIGTLVGVIIGSNSALGLG